MSNNLSNNSILIVDDSEEITDMYSIYLNDKYDVSVANSGKKALERVSSDVDAMLLDRRMPEMTGDDVLRRMDKDGLGIIVIMVTAIDPDTDIIEMPFDDYICKPALKSELLSTIDHHLTTDDNSEPIGAVDELEEARSGSTTNGG